MPSVICATEQGFCILTILFYWQMLWQAKPLCTAAALWFLSYLFPSKIATALKLSLNQFVGVHTKHLPLHINHPLPLRRHLHPWRYLHILHNPSMTTQRLQLARGRASASYVHQFLLRLVVRMVPIIISASTTIPAAKSVAIAATRTQKINQPSHRTAHRQVPPSEGRKYTLVGVYPWKSSKSV